MAMANLVINGVTRKLQILGDLPEGGGGGTGPGTVIPTERTYVIGTPKTVVLSLSAWVGTTYNLRFDNYVIGANGVQVGLPSSTDTANAQAVVEAALTVSQTYSAAATSSAAAYATVQLSAIETPTKDITIALFGLEAA